MRFLNWFDNISITVKLSLLGCLMLFALAVPSYFYYDSASQSLSVSANSLQGVSVAQQLILLKKRVSEHQGLAARMLNGDHSAGSDLLSKGADGDALFNQTQQNLTQVSTDKNLVAAIQDAHNKWSAIRTSLAQQNLSSQAAFVAHSTVLNALDDVVSAVLQHFKLNQTQQMVNYQLSQVNFNALPHLTDVLGKLRGKGAGMLAKGQASPQDLQDIKRFLVQSEYPRTELFRNLMAVANGNPQYSDMKRQIESVKRDIQQAMVLAQNEVVSTNGTDSLSAQQYFDDYSNLIDGLYAYQEELVDSLSANLTNLHQHEVTRENKVFTVIVITVILIVLLFVLISRSIGLGIQNILKSLFKLESTDYSANPHTRVRRDEIGKIDGAIENVRAQLEQNQLAAVEAARVKKAMDNSSTCFMIADVHHNICYMNSAVKVLLAEAEQSIKKDLPQFDLNNLMGESIDSFHKNPKHQRGILENLKTTHSAQISLGEYIFKLVLNPIKDDNGTPLGHSVEWHDMTKIVAEQQITTRILESLNCTSTNVMIADAQRNIIYTNRSVAAMLKEAEADLRKVLPHFDADKVVGSNMDIFHKNPAHQSSLLENLKRTYVAQIVVGKRHFRLIANPILDKDGSRLGSVVEWLDRTAEVETEKEIEQLVNAAVRGDFSLRASTSDKQDFELMLAEGLNKLLAITESGLQEISHVLMAISKGDLTKRIETDFDGLFDELKQYCNTTSQNLANTIGDIRRATETIDSASSEIAQGNSDLSSRTEQQASNLEETASSMEQLTSTVQQNADNAKQANGLASDAAKVAETGGKLISEVVGTMGAINDSAQKIEDIIGVIDGIAFQTNILALNAAVEAARAGEQGRGFAVVASEVRTLAQRSATAAKDIKELISDSVDKVESGNELVSQSGETMREIVTAIQKVNDIMSEIASASIEQASGIEEVNRAVTQMDEMTQQNAALVEQAAAAAESLSSQAGQLTSRVNTFTLDESFVSSSEPKALSAPPKPAKSVAPTGNIAPPASPDEDDDWESF